MQRAGYQCSSHQDQSHRRYVLGLVFRITFCVSKRLELTVFGRKRHQNPRSRCSISSSCSRSFRNEDWQNRGCYPYTVRFDTSEGRSKRSSSVRWYSWGDLGALVWERGKQGEYWFPGLLKYPVAASDILDQMQKLL